MAALFAGLLACQTWAPLTSIVGLLCFINSAIIEVAVKLLVTNDDGWNSLGISVLREELQRAGHTVAVIAPDRPRSACSHAITAFRPISLIEHSDMLYVSSGTPADCVLLGLRGGLDFSAEAVLSGINHGANLGRDIVYSGTVAAARQAAFMGQPGIALSLCIGNSVQPQPDDFRPLAILVANRLEEFCQAWRPNHLININAPHNGGKPSDMIVTTLSQRKYEERFTSLDTPDSSARYFIMNGNPIEIQEEPTSDLSAILAGHTSLNPVMINYDSLAANGSYDSLCSALEMER